MYNMFPTTNFEDIYTYTSCPARLYLKLAGFKSEVTRSYNPPKVALSELGKVGEAIISEYYKPKFDIPELEIPSKPVKPIKGKFNKIIQKLIEICRNNALIALSNLDNIKVKYSPVKYSELGRRIKKDYGVDAILEKVGFTTVPHHFIGELDFLGITEKEEFLVIEAKNKRGIDKKDLLKLEYYIYGLPKGYQFTKIFNNAFELMSQLYPSKAVEIIQHIRRLDFLAAELSEIIGIIVKTLEQNEFYLSEFKNKYGKLEVDILVKVDSTISNIPMISGGLQYIEQDTGIKKFLSEIPECAELIKTYRDYERKVEFDTTDIINTANYISDIMAHGVKDGIIVNARDSSIIEAELTTDFDKLIYDIWSIKKNVLKQNWCATRNLKSCNYCQFKNACKNIKETELEKVRSITSIVHKSIDKMGFRCSNRNRPSLITGEKSNSLWIPSPLLEVKIGDAFILDPKVEDILKIALTNSDWGYEEWYSKKPRWKSLFIDAVESNKLNTEFKFWNI
ncbi:MAG: hypothetical protein OdinLCB4_006785 [Candidatus Odinarchaeum yellowstonii]|uniref:Uncharacterized protein n=1 Tax=Odinarchaeota yellowstonii (strain LCB_4) TaxID=1841599 RepID=A0AAF0D1Y9_ODILC|nr:MAG: hypothetical protein OdinLCB4_006785 [Candidatus Odinarchaeum yellowstonii]